MIIPDDPPVGTKFKNHNESTIKILEVRIRVYKQGDSDVRLFDYTVDQDDKNFDKKKLPDTLREVADNMDILFQQK